MTAFSEEVEEMVAHIVQVPPLRARLLHTQGFGVLGFGVLGFGVWSLELRGLTMRSCSWTLLLLLLLLTLQGLGDFTRT